MFTIKTAKRVASTAYAVYFSGYCTSGQELQIGLGMAV